MTSYFDRKQSCCWLFMLLECMSKSKTFQNEIKPMPANILLRRLCVCLFKLAELPKLWMYTADTLSVELNDPAAQKTKFITLANKPSFRGCLQIRHALCLNYDRRFHWYVRQFRKSSFTSKFYYYLLKQKNLKLSPERTPPRTVETNGTDVSLS